MPFFGLYLRMVFRGLERLLVSFSFPIVFSDRCYAAGDFEIHMKIKEDCFLRKGASRSD